jgi:hypothetical protein
MSSALSRGSRPAEFPARCVEGRYDRRVDAKGNERALADAQHAFDEELRASAPAVVAAIRDELRAEAAPVLEALLASADSDLASDAHEARTLATLFGRRVATLGQSPTIALRCMDAAVSATKRAGAPITTELACASRDAAMEGFAAAVEERTRTEMIDHAGRALLPLTVSPRVLLLVIAGVGDADTIAAALARLGRAALDADAKACIVHASFADAPDRDVTAEIAAFDDSARMIGASAVFSGSPLARHALTGHSSALRVTETFEDALRVALEAAEQEVRPSSLLARSLKRLRR